MTLGNNNWNEVFLFASQLSCSKPCHSQGSAECRTCYNSSPACGATIEDASKPNSSFCCLCSYWLPPWAQLSHHFPMHGISSINSELGQNFLSNNNVMLVVEGAGQGDSFSRRMLRVVLNHIISPATCILHPCKILSFSPGFSISFCNWVFGLVCQNGKYWHEKQNDSRYKTWHASGAHVAGLTRCWVSLPKELPSALVFLLTSQNGKIWRASGLGPQRVKYTEVLISEHLGHGGLRLEKDRTLLTARWFMLVMDWGISSIK